MSDITNAKCTGQQPDVPLAVVEEILLNLPEHQVVGVCRLVCREWKELVDSTAHWRERCRREGIKPCNASRPPEDWRQFYFLSRRRRNLIKNPRADGESQPSALVEMDPEELKKRLDSRKCGTSSLRKHADNCDGLQGWKILRNGGDQWAVEENRKPFPEDTVTKCFVTSYGSCLKRQLIDLKKEGYNAAFMDQLQPHIKISDWYAPRFDCGCQYEVCVKLLNQKKNPIKTFEPEKVFFQQWNDEPWCQMTHVFKDYGPGVRFICFTHGGVDTQFWAGHFGIRVTNSSVEICPFEEK